MSIRVHDLVIFIQKLKNELLFQEYVNDSGLFRQGGEHFILLAILGSSVKVFKSNSYVNVIQLLTPQFGRKLFKSKNSRGSSSSLPL